MARAIARGAFAFHSTKQRIVTTSGGAVEGWRFGHAFRVPEADGPGRQRGIGKVRLFERIKLLSGWVAGGGGHVARPAERWKTPRCSIFGDKGTNYCTKRKSATALVQSPPSRASRGAGA